MNKFLVFFGISILVSTAAVAGSRNADELPGLAIREDFRERIDEARSWRQRIIEERESLEFWKEQSAKFLAGDRLDEKVKYVERSASLKRSAAKARECFRLKQSFSSSGHEENYDFYDTSTLCKNVRAKNSEYLKQRVAELQKKYPSNKSLSEINYLTDYYVGTLKQAQFFTHNSDGLLNALSAESKIPKTDFKKEIAIVGLAVALYAMEQAYQRHDDDRDRVREWIDPGAETQRGPLVPESERVEQEPAAR